MTPEQYELHKNMIKLVACSQVVIELIDELQGTQAYRHDVKFHAKGLADKLDKFLGQSYSYLTKGENEDTYRTVERGIRRCLETPIEDLYELGMIGDELES